MGFSPVQPKNRTIFNSLSILEENVNGRLEFYLIGVTNNTFFNREAKQHNSCGHIILKMALSDLKIIQNIFFLEEFSDGLTIKVTPDNKFITTNNCEIIEVRYNCSLGEVNSFPLEICYDFVFMDNANLLIGMKPKGGIQIWDYLKGALVREININDNISTFDYNNKNGIVATLHHLDFNSSIKFYYVESGKFIEEFQSAHGEIYDRILFSHNGSYLLAEGDRIIHVFDTKSLKLIASYTEFISKSEPYWRHSKLCMPGVGAIKSIFDDSDEYIYTIDCKGVIYKWK